MKILKNAVAGTLESSDLFIQIEPDEKELTLEIDSVVANQCNYSYYERNVQHFQWRITGNWKGQYPYD